MSIRFSIRYQLMLPLLALMLGLVGVSTWNAWSSGQRARQQIEKQIDDIATTVNAGAFPLNAQTLHLMKGLSGAEFLVCDEQRRPVRDPHDNVIATLAELPDWLPEPGDHPTQHFDKPVQIGAANYLCGGLPLRRGSRPEAILYILYPESTWREAVWESLRPALTLGIGGSAISVFLSVLLTTQISRRIQQMEQRTRMIANGDFSPMPLPRRDDELTDLGKSVNEMAAQLAQFQTTIRQTERLRLLGQVSGGLAHQLRNGVAGARLAVQLHVQDCSAPQGAESLTVALRQLSLVELHLKRFLDLGKTIELQRQPCDLVKLLRDTMELVGPQCRHGHIDLRESGSPTPIELLGDPGQFEPAFLERGDERDRGGGASRLGRGALGDRRRPGICRSPRFRPRADAGDFRAAVRAVRHRQARRSRAGAGCGAAGCRGTRRRNRLEPGRRRHLFSHRAAARLGILRSIHESRLDR